jgi:hypothetical protein
MFIKQTVCETSHVRKSKLGAEHTYKRKKTLVHFRCDNCNTEFTRERGKMDPKRLSNNYFHVCSNCDAKKFAQRKGVERKHVWNMSASSNMPIGRL